MTFRLATLPVFGLIALASGCAGSSAPDEYESDAPDSDDPVVVDPTCDDAITNGDETDIDCGGADCAPCDLGQVCLEDSDCDDSACFDGTCEQVMIVRGIGAEEPGKLFATQQLFRVDFVSEPSVTDFDGSPRPLVVSEGKFVGEGIAEAAAGTQITINGVSMVRPSGETGYQSIAPDYFGFLMKTTDDNAAIANHEAVLAADLAGKEIEIRILDPRL